MTDIDAEPGFDRRALIKKGLVAGGIVATAPVISTFNTAAFASSVPGCHQLQFSVSGNTGGANPTFASVRVNETSQPDCEPSGGTCTWVGTNTQDPDLALNTSFTQSTSNVGNGSVTWTLVGSYASCEIVAATAFGGGGAGACQPATVFSPNPIVPGTTSITFTRPQNNQTYNVRLIVFC